MSKILCTNKIICRMHENLNRIIEKNDFDLLCDEVLKYSKKLDRIIAIYLSDKRRKRKNSSSDKIREIKCFYSINNRMI